MKSLLLVFNIWNISFLLLFLVNDLLFSLSFKKESFPLKEDDDESFSLIDLTIFLIKDLGYDLSQFLFFSLFSSKFNKIFLHISYN